MNKNTSRRISRKKVTEDRYIQFYEFLLFDPIYKDMSEKSKVLYTFLRSKIPMFENKQEEYENGVEGSRSYADDNGYIYIIADNTELMYLLNCSEPTIVKMKKELHKYGLLDEDPVKHSANRIYVLTPPVLSEKWAYVGEIIELREKREQKRREKHEKSKAKAKQKKVVEKEQQMEAVLSDLEEKKKGVNDVQTLDNIDDLKKLSHQKTPSNTDSKIHDLNNLSHGNLNNFSHDDLNNLSEYQSNLLNSNLISQIESNKNIDDDEKKIVNFQINNSAFQDFANHFFEQYKFDNSMFQLIYEQMETQQLDFFTIQEAERQAKRMIEYGLDKINDYAAYFVGGIIRNRTGKERALDEAKWAEAKKEDNARMKENEMNRPKKVQFYNWLVERDDKKPVQRQKETVPRSSPRVIIDNDDLPF